MILTPPDSFRVRHEASAEQNLTEMDFDITSVKKKRKCGLLIYSNTRGKTGDDLLDGTCAFFSDTLSFLSLHVWEYFSEQRTSNLSRGH